MKTTFTKSFAVVALCLFFSAVVGGVSEAHAQSFDGSYLYSDGNTLFGDVNCLGCITAGQASTVVPTFDNSYIYNDGNTFLGDVSCVSCGVQTQPVVQTEVQAASPVYVQDTSSINLWYNQPAYGYGQPVYTSSYGYNGYGYGTVNTIPSTVTTLCSNGSTPVNGSCSTVTTIPVTTNTICSDGQAPVNNSCVRTNTINTVTNTLCSDGLLPTNGSCVRTNVINTTQYPNYNYSTYQSYPTVTYQTCWDGSHIPSTQLCSSQYRVCANGTSVPLYQACYVDSTPRYIPTPVVEFNNAVTSPATQVTNTSGRCNGVGLIANGTPSTGWFEYGETVNLGRATAAANIGTAYSAPFSNVLTNLKPSTRYYCRAVMRNSYGVVKGEIVGFTTKARATTYVKPVVTPKKFSTKAPVKKTEILCADGTTVSTKNTSTASLLNAGQKLISVSLEKGEGKMTSNAIVGYKVSYKNVSGSRLTGVIVTVTLPPEITFISSTSGNYDEASRTLILNQDSLDPYTEGTILVTGKVMSNAPLGKSIVTNLYAAYTVPDTQTQDEVTAYQVSSIVPATDISKVDTGAKKVIGADSERGFMPTSLIEWLALLAILFIIFILGRSIYASYHESDGHGH